MDENLSEKPTKNRQAAGANTSGELVYQLNEAGDIQYVKYVKMDENLSKIPTKNRQAAGVNTSGELESHQILSLP